MKIIEQIENILKVSSKARNSDKEMMIIYMQKFGLELSDKQIAKFREMPSFESLRRSRQILQEQGKYPASEEVDKFRHDKYVEMRSSRANLILEENFRR